MEHTSELLVAARDAHRRHDWAAAYDGFVEARREIDLNAGDLDAMSDAAWWLGLIDECLVASEAAFRRHLDDGHPRRAATTALDLAVTLLLRGEDSRGSGWLSRAQRLLDGLSVGPEHGYVRYLLDVEGGLDGRDLDGLAEAARDVQEIGRAHGDPNLMAAGVLGEGRALVKLGDVERGTRLLDEAMVAVLDEELEPEWAGNIYCHLMAACHELADLRRAAEWVEATATWLSQLPPAVLFTGVCRVHRSQVLQVTGEWDRAVVEAEQVCRDLADVHVASVAEAYYQVGEMRRLRGDLDGAEQAYTDARERGRDPQPGLALLRLAQGRTRDAAAAIRAAVHGVGSDRLARARLRGAQVEIALADGDVEMADRGCAELEDAAATYGTSGLEAAALQWRGAVALAGGRPEEALPALRAACRRWREVRAPYDAARVCVLLGQAYDALGDHDAHVAELRTARETFQRLGATPDAERVAAMLGRRSLPGGLTEREAEVLSLVAEGLTNRQVAERLVLSEKTIARHLSNIFTKLDVSTRTEAAAFAFDNRLAGSGRG